MSYDQLLINAVTEQRNQAVNANAELTASLRMAVQEINSLKAEIAKLKAPAEIDNAA